MKGKTNGLLRILASLVVIGIMLFIAIFGIGSDKLGSIRNVKLGLDLAGGVSVTYQTVKDDPTETEIEDTRDKLQRRAEAFSTESAVYTESGNRINVDIPDVTDADAVLEKLGSAGTIYFIYGKGPDGIQNIEAVYNAVTGDYDFNLLRSIEEIVASGDVVVDGSDIASAEPDSYQQTLEMKHVVSLKLNEAGAKKFADGTRYAASYGKSNAANFVYENIIAIVYDGVVISAPGVNEAIEGGQAVIEGQSNYEEAKELASIIRIGALPVELSVLRYNVVGAKLGIEAIDTSLLAGIIGFILIAIFMVVMYRVQGLAADLALTLYIALMIIALNIFGVTLTLPGVAGILLSVGMAVDANVIIFTRIQEELATGKTVRSSIKSGFSKAMSAIVDGNVTTIIAAVVLFFIGSGTVKGFAQTLMIGIVLSMVTALFVTKFILTSLFSLGFTSVKCYGTKREPKTRKYVKNFPRFIIISGAILVVGIVAMIVNKSTKGEFFNYGLDFQGGTSTEVTLPEDITIDTQKEVEKLVSDTLGITSEIARIEGESSLIIKTRELSTEERKALTDALVDKYNVDEELILTTSISSTISGEMKRDAILAVVIATICMLIYIIIRFKNVSFAASAVFALIHDVLLVLMVYAIAGNWISVGNTFIACMLTIVGYSINATIVIFDRIRENMSLKLKKDTVADVADLSISQTFTRSIYTTLTTFIMVFMLAIIGVDSVKEFAIPLIAGLGFGAFSSICLTSGAWYRLSKKKIAE